MTKAWSAFYQDCLPELPGAPLPVVDHWLRNAAIEFCERTKALVVDLTAMDSVANQMQYAITLPTNTELVEVVGVLFSGEPLTPQAPLFIERKFGDWMSKAGTPECYTQQDGSGLLLVPAPASAAPGAIRIKAAIKPSIAATGVEDWIFSRWRTAISAGAKARLMIMDGKPWSNDTKADVNQNQFERAVAEETCRARNGFVRARPRFSGKFC